MEVDSSTDNFTQSESDPATSLAGDCGNLIFAEGLSIALLFAEPPSSSLTPEMLFTKLLDYFRRMTDSSDFASIFRGIITEIVKCVCPELVPYFTTALTTNEFLFFSLNQRIRDFILEFGPVGTQFYKTGVVLGEGASSIVYLGTHVRVALKIIPLKKISPSAKNRLREEIQLMSNYRSSYCIHLYAHVFNEATNELILCMEYCPWFDLEYYIERELKGEIPMPLIQHLMRELAGCVWWLHDNGIIHRDIKPANVLCFFDDGEWPHLKLCDFSTARRLNAGELASTLVGTPYYMSPSIYNGLSYTNKADMWSLGVIFYRLLYRNYPWHGPNVLVLDTREVPDVTKEAVAGLLNKDSLARTSASALLLHPALVPVEARTPGASHTNIVTGRELDLSRRLAQLEIRLAQMQIDHQRLSEENEQLKKKPKGNKKSIVQKFGKVTRGGSKRGLED